MSFERTKGSITNLSTGDVFADSLLDMMVCVARDTYEVSGVTSAAALPVQDQATLLKKMYNLIKMIIGLYDGNKEGISQFSERIQNDYRAAMDLLVTQNKNLEKIIKTTEEEEQTLTKLQATAQEVENRRGHLLQVREQCAELQGKIDRLNDPALDALADQKKALEAELAQRQQRETTLKEEQKNLRSQLSETEKRIAAQEKTPQQIQDQLTQLQKNERDMVQRKNTMEADMVEIRGKLEEMEKAIENLPALRDKINDAYRDVQVQMIAMTNAVNSAKSDAFLEANLYAKEAGGALTVENYPDLAVAGKQVENWEDLEAWFAQLEARINGLMQVYCETLEAVVKKAETITVKKEQE